MSPPPAATSGAGKHKPFRHLGELTPFSDKLVLRILSWSNGADLLRLSGACRTLYSFTSPQTRWREMCMETVGEKEGRVDGKTAAFQFKVCWKLTYFRPERLSAEQIAAAPRPLFGGVCDALPHGFYHLKGASREKWYRSSVDVTSIPYSGRWVERVNAAEVSEVEFFKRFDARNTPVVVSGASAHWKWADMSLAALREEYGDTVFKTNGVTEDGRTLRMALKDYLSYAEHAWGQGEKPLYIFDNKFEQRAQSLPQRYCVPPYFKEDLFASMSAADRPDYRWLLIGPQGSGAPFHTDPHMTHAWNVVTVGKKRVSFYPPTVIPPGVDESLIHTEYYAAKDTMEWYLEVLPTLFGTPARLPLECVVEAGEMVFIPSGWWHQVLNVAPVTAAVTQNVCSRGNFNRVWCELQKRGPKSLETRFRRDILKAGYGKLLQAYERPADMPSSDDEDSDDDTTTSSGSTDSTSTSDS